MGDRTTTDATDSSMLIELGEGQAWPKFDEAVGALGGQPNSPNPANARNLFADGVQTPAPGEIGSGVPEQLGKFRLVKEVGRGRFGIVYLAKDDQLDREVAIKVARPEVAADDEHRGRFGREAELAAGLDHPGIVPVHEVGVEGPWLYIVMGYCDGDTLADWFKEHRESLTPSLAVRLIKQLADAIAHGHTRGVVHRDLKPSNVGVITSEDQPANPSDVSGVIQDGRQPGDPELRVYDFGLSCAVEFHLRDTRTSLSIGTPLYMAPEQLRGSDVTPAADVYSIGTMLYELLTEVCPFEAETQPQVLHKLWHDDPTPPRELNAGVDRDLEAVVLKALSKRPETRYPDAGALAEELSRWLRGRPTMARPSTWATRFRLWSERPSRVREAGAVVLTQHLVLPAWTLFGQLGPNAAFGSLDEGELISPQMAGAGLVHLLFFYVGYQLWANRASRVWLKFAFIIAFLLVPLHLSRGLGWLPAPNDWYEANPDMRWLIFWLMSLTAGIDLIAIAIALRSDRRRRLDRA